MMNIKHIINRNILDSWSFYSEMEKMFEESSSEIYSLMIYRNKNISDLEYKYQLVSHKKLKTYWVSHKNLLRTDSKEEMKMTLDLMGLRIKRINIIMEKNLNNEMFLPYSVVDLTNE